MSLESVKIIWTIFILKFRKSHFSNLQLVLNKLRHSSWSRKSLEKAWKCLFRPFPFIFSRWHRFNYIKTFPKTSWSSHRVLNLKQRYKKTLEKFRKLVMSIWPLSWARFKPDSSQIQEDFGFPAEWHAMEMKMKSKKVGKSIIFYIFTWKINIFTINSSFKFEISCNLLRKVCFVLIFT